MIETKPAVYGLKLDGQTAIGMRVFEAPYTYQDSLINEARLVHVIKGRSSLICAGKTISLNAGDTLLMKADNFINRWLEQEQGNSVEFIGFRLTHSLLQKLFETERVTPTILVGMSTDGEATESAEKLTSSPLLTSFFSGVKHYFLHNTEISDAIIELKIRELIELMVMHDSTGQIKALLKQLFVPNHPNLQQVVQTHLFSPINTEDMAFLCHMSVSTFNRKFKQVFGTSVNQYVIAKRLEKAHQLILATNDSLTNIALECGFEELSYFSRQFKQRYQLSPSSLRK